LKDLVVDGNIILKWGLKNTVGHKNGLMCLSTGACAGSCENCNEPWGSI